MIPFGRPPTRKEHEEVYRFTRHLEAPLNDWLQSQGTNITASDIIRCIVSNWSTTEADDPAVRLLIERLNLPPGDPSPQLFDDEIARRSLKIAIGCLASIADQSTEPESAAEAEHALNVIGGICEAPSLPGESHAPSQRH